MKKAKQKPEVFNLSQMSISTDGRIKATWITPSGEDSTRRKQPPHKDLEKAKSKVEGYLAQYYDLNEDRVTLKSITVKYYEDDKGESVTIKGNYTHSDSEQVTSISTASIPLHLEHYGFESDLKKALSTLSKEVEKWVFEYKSSQSSMKLEVAS